MQFASNPGHRACSQRSGRLFLPSSQIAQDTGILRENVLAGSDDRDGRFLKVLVIPLAVWTLVRHGVLLELGKDVADLQAFLEVCPNWRQLFATVEGNRMVLVIRFAATENGVTRKLDAKLGSSTLE